VFLADHSDIPMSVQALKDGVIDFLTRPVRDQTLIDAVVEASEGTWRSAPKPLLSKSMSSDWQR
jgi:FixJ family two-component response regulator